MILRGLAILLLCLPLSLWAKPNITIFATGGTIAGSSASKTDTANYTAGALGIDILLNAVPEMQQIAEVKGEQLVSVDSNNITQQILLTLVNKITQTLSQPEQQGVVITHGTDTLEETAFFLDLTLKTDKPVVLVGAMRPATAISADGPMNLLQAVALAADENAKNRGVLTLSNDRISSGFYITKTNTQAVDTFKAIEQGYLGVFSNGQAKFYYTPAQPTNKPYFDVKGKDTLAKVVVLYGHQDMDNKLLYQAVTDGAKGIVLAASGNGSLPEVLNSTVDELMAKGIPVILASKTGSGIVTKKDRGIGAGIYSPSKARILLSLALDAGADMQQIRDYFEN